MEKRKVKDILLKARDKNGEEAWISLEELGRTIFSTALETIQESLKELLKPEKKVEDKELKEQTLKSTEKKGQNIDKGFACGTKDCSFNDKKGNCKEGSRTEHCPYSKPKAI